MKQLVHDGRPPVGIRAGLGGEPRLERVGAEGPFVQGGKQ